MPISASIPLKCCSTTFLDINQLTFHYKYVHAAEGRIFSPYPISLSVQQEIHQSLLQELIAISPETDRIMSSASILNPSPLNPAYAPIQQSSALSIPCAKRTHSSAAFSLSSSPVKFARNDQADEDILSSSLSFLTLAVDPLPLLDPLFPIIDDRRYKCSVEGCTKAYKNSNGLKVIILQANLVSCRTWTLGC